jgi:pyruvate/2-oxoglutarate dehydrogenase complex dihydrolipoamide dehydrogenase (E3) component
MTISPPRHSDLLVVGGGAAGLSAASVAARTGSRVTLVERDRLGGDCLYTGCIPSKTLLRAAALAHAQRRAGAYGIAAHEPVVDFTTLREHLQQVIRRIEPEDSEERYQSLGVTVVRGEARVEPDLSLRVDEIRFTGRSLVIATGATPRLPDLPGLTGAPWFTSETLWELKKLPGHLVILGGGPLGCEIGQAYHRLGSQVTILESAPRLLGSEPEAISRTLTSALREEGLRILTGCHTQRIEQTDGRFELLLGNENGSLERHPFDALLIAVGRQARTAGLEALELAREPSGLIQSDVFLRTSRRGCYAAGDVTSRLQFTHVAGQQGAYAALNALFRPLLRLRWATSPIPRVTYTDPEVASVETEMAGDAIESLEIPLAEINRAITDGAEHGVVQVGIDRQGRLVSASLCMPHAGESIALVALAMRERFSLSRLLGLIQPYPTYAEIHRRMATRWQERHMGPASRRFAKTLLGLLRTLDGTGS